MGRAGDTQGTRRGHAGDAQGTRRAQGNIFSHILFFHLIVWAQPSDTIFENQLYFKLNSLDNISPSSWESVESSPNNISSEIFTFGNYLDSQVNLNNFYCLS